LEYESLDLQFDSEEKYVTGEVLAIYFSNPSNFYKVMLIKIEEKNVNYEDSKIVVVGNFGQIQEGDSYEFYGKLTNHPKYGIQFQADRYAKNQPSSEEAIVTYLSGSRFKGIGEKTAQKIVDTLGKDCIDVILDEPEQLERVSGLNKAKRETIVKVLEDEQGMQKSILTLNRYGISNQLAYRIYAFYEEDTLSTIQKNPYQLASDIKGIGFNRADNIAEELGIPEDSPERIQAGIMYSISEISMNNGDTYVDSETLLKKSIDILERSRSFIIDPELIADNLIQMLDEQTIIQDEDRFYLPSLFASEWGIVSAIERIQETPFTETDEEKIKNQIKDLENDLDIKYGASQEEAIIQAINSPMFVLTGGPGTGKTTVLNGIVQLFAEIHDLSLDPYAYKDESFPILLTAPTGRAAKRMSESTDLPSTTIHRLLGLTADDQEGDEANIRLSGKLLIVDEMSMVDTWLAYQLFKSIPGDMQVIMVGDKDQLPSVGPGQILRDLIDSETLSQKELTEIYRQNNNSSIIPLAHHIKNNELPKDFREPKIDRSFIHCNTNKVLSAVEKVVSKAIEKGYTANEIQVLAPMYKGKAGIDNLNEHLQNLFNPNEYGERKEVKHINSVYRINDKVLQLINDADRNVFNGDMGTITGIVPAKESEMKTDELVIDFEGNEVRYLRNEWNKITLAYCCSIHKAQGSEYDMVILPMVHGYRRMLKKDLLYTAITRASQFLILLGEEASYEQSLHQTSMLRKTTLKERLVREESIVTENNQKDENLVDEKIEYSDVESSDQSILTSEVIAKYKIDPMIGMDGITPYNI